MRNLLVLLAATAGVTATAAEAQGQAAPPVRAVSLAHAFPHLGLFRSKIDAAAQRVFTLAYYWTLDGRPADKVDAWIEAGSQRRPLDVGADGRVERLPTAAETAGRSRVLIAAPASARFAVHLELQAAMAPAKELQAAEVTQAIDTTAEAVRRAAGPVGLVIPKIKKAAFVDGGSGSAILADGRIVVLPSDEDGPIYEPRRLRDAVRLRFTHTPSRVKLED